ncbi:MAG: hypothetical protein IPK19_19075 [Chloroflexi bacterium]|nr:hypothetical protein [Chloroflexota bacterium]
MKALRRFMLLALCVLLGVTLVQAQEDTLTVFDWAGYDLEGFWAPFAEANPDVTVEFTYITEDSEAFARMASGLETDVLHPCWHQPYIDSSLVQGLDTSRLSNWESIPAVLTTRARARTASSTSCRTSGAIPR